MICLLITARMGSSRLPQKHLIEANGKPLLYWLIRRYENEFQNEIRDGKVAIAIATSDKPGNEKFAEACKDTSCRVIHGSDNNIPLRHLQCAKQLKATHVISIDGDDILCSTQAARIVYQQMLADSSHDLFSVTGLPLGMNLSGYSVAYLEDALKANTQSKLETGWGRVFVNPRSWTKQIADYDVMGDLRFTLDYAEDATFFCRVINELKEKVVSIKDEDLIKFVEEHKLYKINSGLKNEYWNNYNSEKQKEINEQQ